MPMFNPLRSVGLANGFFLASEIMASGLCWLTAAMATTGKPCERDTASVGRSPKPKSALPLATRRKASGVPVPLRIAVTVMPFSLK
jgi:hypothetical protein